MTIYHIVSWRDTPLNCISSDMSCIFVIWKITQVPLSPCRLACDNFQPPFGQSWFTRSARAASLQWCIFCSQLIILTSLKDESGKILKKALCFEQFGNRNWCKPKKKLNLLIGPLVKFSMQEQQKLKTCWYLPTIFVAVPKESHPKYQTPQDSKTCYFMLFWHNTGSIHPSDWRVQSLILRAPKKSWHKKSCQQAAYILEWIQQGSRCHVNQWKHPMPEAKSLWKENRLGTAICFVTKDIYLCRIAYNTLFSLQGVVFMVTKSNFNHLRFW